MKVSILALFGLASCLGTSESVLLKHVQTASVAYDVPDDWTRTQSSMRGVATTVWTPMDNPDHISVTVIRSERSPLTATSADDAAIEQLLVQSQKALYKADVAPPMLLTTTQGLTGARVELEYTPPGAKTRYHRTHAVLRDGTGLVHVMFTGQAKSTPAFDTVLASIRHEEALP